MARRVSWTNNSSGHLGSYVYRAESLDPQNLPAPVATFGPVAQGSPAEWIDNDTLNGSYCYAVQDYDGESAGVVSEDVCVQLGDDFSSAQIGDEIGGGIYAGIRTINGSDYYLVSAKRSGQSSGVQWGNYGTETGADDLDDGKANQELVLTSFDNGDYDAFYHCRDYVDGDGNNDYYLPSRNDVELIGTNLIATAHPEFDDGSGLLWASTEFSSANAYYVRLSDGTIGSGTGKNSTVPFARPVRRVAV